MKFEGIDREAPQSAEREARFAGDRWVLESRVTEGAAAAGALKERLQQAGWSEDEIGQIDYALNEAITNAVTHGNLGIERLPDETNEAYEARLAEAENSEDNDKYVTVEIVLSPRDVVITVEDEAKKRIDPAKLPDPTTPEGLAKANGRGLYTIIKSCDESDLSIPGRVFMRKYKRTGDEI